MVPSARRASCAAVAGGSLAFNVRWRAAIALTLVGWTARAEPHPFEAPATGLIVGLEIGVLVAALADAREASTLAWTMVVGGAGGVGAGVWAGSLRDEPGAPMVLRAAAVGLAIPAVVLFWSRSCEPPSLRASEDSSPLARAGGAHLPNENLPRECRPFI